jgi:mannosyltransferase OCH1-like enzyme
MIPKVIYQTWYKKNIPEPIQNAINLMMEQNPNYSHHLYDDNDIEDFIKNNFNENIYSAYKCLTVGAAKADLWRYLVLFKYGGVYLDIDSVIYGKLNELIVDDYAIISREKNYGKFVQWCLIYPANHPILKICIDKCIFNITNRTTNDILELTGPVVYSQSIKEYFNDNDIYIKNDDYINQRKDITKTKVYLWDYHGYAHFRHPESDVLYTDKKHWRDEQQLKKVVD